MYQACCAVFSSTQPNSSPKITPRLAVSHRASYVAVVDHRRALKTFAIEQCPSRLERYVYDVLASLFALKACRCLPAPSNVLFYLFMLTFRGMHCGGTCKPCVTVTSPSLPALGCFVADQSERSPTNERPGAVPRWSAKLKSLPLCAVRICLQVTPPLQCTVRNVLSPLADCAARPAILRRVPAEVYKSLGGQPWIPPPKPHLTSPVRHLPRTLPTPPELRDDMTIDQRGGIAIAEIILYFPILILSIFLIVRHGATRKAGWIFFAILSVGEFSI